MLVGTRSRLFARPVAASMVATVATLKTRL